MINEPQLEQIKKQLMAEANQLQGQKEQRQQMGMNPDRDDRAQQFISRERRMALRSVKNERLTQIQKALEKIESGTYGRCEQCGDSIAPGRLEIIPYATSCISCQQAQRSFTSYS